MGDEVEAFGAGGDAGEVEPGADEGGVWGWGGGLIWGGAAV